MNTLKFRSILRCFVDRMHYRSIPGTQLIGGGSDWAVNVIRLPEFPKVISGGVGKDISFELALAKNFKAAVALFDPSPTGRETINLLGNLPAGISFHAKGLAGESRQVGFARPEHADEGSWRSLPGAVDSTFQCLDYSDALAIQNWSSCDLVKIDIEGFEYEFVKSILASKNLPSQIAVETHEFLPGHSIAETKTLKRELYNAGYELVWKRRHDHLFVRK